MKKDRILANLPAILDPISLKWRSRGIGPALQAKHISQTGELILICSPAVPFALPLFVWPSERQGNTAKIDVFRGVAAYFKA